MGLIQSKCAQPASASAATASVLSRAMAENRREY